MIPEEEPRVLVLYLIESVNASTLFRQEIERFDKEYLDLKAEFLTSGYPCSEFKESATMDFLIGSSEERPKGLSAWLLKKGLPEQWSRSVHP